MDAKSRALQSYKQKYNRDPEYLVRAPGRVNIIGEHTDYNDGFVLPCAIDRDTVVAIGPSANGNIDTLSYDYDAFDSFDIRQDIKTTDQEWANYVRGVTKHIGIEGYALTPSQMSIAGDVPLGSGLSSSAALEIAVGRALLEQAKHNIDPSELALIAQKAENQFVGCACGIMDQLISAKGQKDHALLIDCRSLDCTAISIPQDTAIIIVNSGVTHSHAGGEYNDRREQCEKAAMHYGVKALRDINEEELENNKAGLDDIVYRRARHVVTENARTLAAAQALKSNDLQTLGKLMIQSHISMKDDFEITVPAIDQLADIMNSAINSDGGARMTGGGFGGCVVGLIKEENVEEIIDAIHTKYKTPDQKNADILISKASAGANII